MLPAGVGRAACAVCRPRGQGWGLLPLPPRPPPSHRQAGTQATWLGTHFAAPTRPHPSLEGTGLVPPAPPRAGPGSAQGACGLERCLIPGRLARGHVAGTGPAPWLCLQLLGSDGVGVGAAEGREPPTCGTACPPRPSVIRSLCVSQAIVLGTKLRLQADLDVEKVRVVLTQTA